MGRRDGAGKEERGAEMEGSIARLVHLCFRISKQSCNFGGCFVSFTFKFATAAEAVTPNSGGETSEASELEFRRWGWRRTPRAGLHMYIKIAHSIRQKCSIIISIERK